MTTLAHKLERWWFAPDAGHQPGIWRIVIACWAVYRAFTQVVPRLGDFATRPPELVDPVSLARWLSLPMQPSPAAIVGLKVALGVLAFSAIAGIFTRVSMIAFSLATLYALMIANAWGYSAHASGLPSIALFVIALSPGIDALSVDRFVRCRDRFWGEATSIWPLRLILVLLVLTYFAAGVAKLRHSGWRWTDGQTLAFYLSGGSLRDRVSPARFIADKSAPAEARFRDGVGLADWAWVADPTPLGRSLARSPLVTRLLSIFSLLLELLFPLALLGRKPLAALLVLAALFHLGIQATMRISFVPYIVVYLLFVDWYGLARRIRTKIHNKNK